MKRGTDDDREAQLGLHGHGFFHGVRDQRARGFQADLAHGVAELLAILGRIDGFARGADHLDAVLLQHAFAHQVQRGVQRRLPAHGGQQRIGRSLLDDARHRAPVDRLDVDGIGHAPGRS